MPMVAKITKGQHSGVLGVPSLSSPNLCNTALFLNAGKNFQIVAQPIKMKEGKKSSSVGSKIILIPDSYNGFFELLSEEGRSTKPFESVLELSRRRNIHEKVIVRETFVIRLNNTNKTLNAGEILTPISDDGKFLQCRTSKNQLISLPLDCKAKFSPLAKEKEDSISGVHTVIRNMNDSDLCVSQFTFNIIFFLLFSFLLFFLFFCGAASLVPLFDIGKKFIEEANATNCTIDTWNAPKRFKIVICARI